MMIFASYEDFFQTRNT